MSRKLKDCIQVSVYEEVDGRTRTPLKKKQKVRGKQGRRERGSSKILGRPGGVGSSETLHSLGRLMVSSPLLADTKQGAS